MAAMARKAARIGETRFQYSDPKLRRRAWPPKRLHLRRRTDVASGTAHPARSRAVNLQGFRGSQLRKVWFVNSALAG
jgi:hypothetical protein